MLYSDAVSYWQPGNSWVQCSIYIVAMNAAPFRINARQQERPAAPREGCSPYAVQARLSIGSLAADLIVCCCDVWAENQPRGICVGGVSVTGCSAPHKDATQTCMPYTSFMCLTAPCPATDSHAWSEVRQSPSNFQFVRGGGLKYGRHLDRRKKLQKAFPEESYFCVSCQKRRKPAI